MKCISRFDLFRGLGKSTRSISIQLEQVRIVKAWVFSFFPLPLSTVYPKLDGVDGLIFCADRPGACQSGRGSRRKPVQQVGCVIPAMSLSF